MEIKRVVFNPFRENTYLVWDATKECIIVDAGNLSAREDKVLAEFIEEQGLTPVLAVNTHCHFDHIYGMAVLAKAYEIPVHADMKEMYSMQVTNDTLCKQFGFPMPEEFPIIKTSSDFSYASRAEWVAEGDLLHVGSLCFEVIQTPGHSKGGLCFLERNEKILLSGDTLFAGAIGRTDHPGGDYDVLMRSIFEKLLMLDGDTRVLPGHGPSSDIATERMTNPFLMPFNEPYEE